jgi:hypothetical protein
MQRIYISSGAQKQSGHHAGPPQLSPNPSERVPGINFPLFHGRAKDSALLKGS